MQRRFSIPLLFILFAGCTVGDPPVPPSDARTERGRSDLKSTFDRGGDVKGACLPPRKLCGEQCLDTTTNISHCGACDNNCAANMGARIDSCYSGLCVCSAASNLPCQPREFCTSSGCESECPPAQQCGVDCCLVSDVCIDSACCPQDRACDGTCCGSSQLCAGGVCCPEARACDDACCGASEDCIGGACCDTNKSCGDTCCSATESCVGTACCDNAKVCDDSCCSASETCVGTACCATDKACNDSCCGASETCVDDSCCDTGKVCGDSCCGASEDCVGGECCDSSNLCGADCCRTGETCVSDTCCPSVQICDGACCATGEMCINNSCCAVGKACGSVCCGSSEFCFDWVCSDPLSGNTALYATTQRFNGNLGGRSGADAKCAAEKPPELTCQTIAALLSVNIDDEVQDLTGPPHSFSASQKIYYFDRESRHFTICADSWTEALDTGTTPLKNTVSQGTGESFYESFWTGSTGTGGYASAGAWDYTCSGWTGISTTDYYLGTQGDADDLVTWLHSSENYLSCTRELHLLCACKL